MQQALLNLWAQRPTSRRSLSYESSPFFLKTCIGTIVHDDNIYKIYQLLKKNLTAFLSTTPKFGYNGDFAMKFWHLIPIGGG